MLISLNWIKEFVKLPEMDADDLANGFTMATAEVEDVKTTNQHLAVIKVAQIKSLRPHPEADKLNLVTFDFGGKETKEVVCGAPNVREGLKIPYAPLGTTLPNGLTLEPKKIRGVLSDGMLCSETELGLGEGSKGLMELPADAPIGTTMADFLKLNSDIILDVDNKSLTHRPDLWGHYGIAREFSCAYDVDLKNPFDDKWKKNLEAKFSSDKSPIAPKVSKDSSCRAYWGLSVDNVKVGPSPTWLVSRLEAVGLRTINNIVDISNFVMLELGMPNHIFDRDQIKNNVIDIKLLGKEEIFVTLDEFERKLIPSDTVICDSEKPLVLAGIMGGLNSGVSEKTSRVFIEVANWSADEVRKTSTRLGLRTDSSGRFEKSLDSQQCYRSMLRILELICEICPGAKVIGRPEYAGDDLSQHKNLVVKTSVERINKTLGHEVPADRIVGIFKRLDFGVKNEAGKLELSIPSYRTTKDIEYEADVIEEIGRMVGYDNIVPVSPMTGIAATRLSPDNEVKRKIQDFLTLNARSLEVMTYPLIGESLLKKAVWPKLNEELVLVNALSKDADRMRPSLVPHALNTASINAKNYENFSFFEYGRAYLPDNKNFANERYQVLFAMFNKKKSEFVEVINTCERLLNYLNISYDLQGVNDKFDNTLVSHKWDGAHPHEYLNIRVMGKFNGVITSVHPMVLRQFKVKGHLSFFIVDLTDFHTREIKDKIKYSPISKFPASQFDCTVLVNKGDFAASVLEPLKKLKVKEVTSTKVVDVFSLEADKNAVTIRAIIEDPEKTLEPEIIKAAETEIVQVLEKAGYPLKS